VGAAKADEPEVTHRYLSARLLCRDWQTKLESIFRVGAGPVIVKTSRVPYSRRDASFRLRTRLACCRLP
jgi:hypothetical protein